MNPIFIRGMDHTTYCTYFPASCPICHVFLKYKLHCKEIRIFTSYMKLRIRKTNLGIVVFPDTACNLMATKIKSLELNISNAQLL